MSGTRRSGTKRGQGPWKARHSNFHAKRPPARAIVHILLDHPTSNNESAHGDPRARLVDSLNRAAFLAIVTARSGREVATFRRAAEVLVAMSWTLRHEPKLLRDLHVHAKEILAKVADAHIAGVSGARPPIVGTKRTSK